MAMLQFRLLLQDLLNRTVVFLLCVFLGIGFAENGFGQPLSNESLSQEEGYPEYGYAETFPSSLESWTLQTEAGYAAGRWMGFKHSYGELDLLVIPPAVGSWQPFGDVRGYVIHREDWAASFGVGFRTWNHCISGVLGLNVYFDTLEACTGNFKRIGIGGEWLNACYDVRINGYVLIDGTVRKGHSETFCFDDGFIETCHLKESAFEGFDAEIGRYFWRGCCIDLYGAVGPYYFRSKHEKMYGGYIRFEASWKNYVRVELNLSQDNQFHTQFQAKGMITIPFSVFCCEHCSTACRPCLPLVRRNPLIQTRRHCECHHDCICDSFSDSWYDGFSY